MVRPTSDKRKKIEKHFKWLEQNKCYHCSLCKKTLMGTVKSNFLGNSADHLRRCHLEQYNEIMQTNTAQQVLNFNATAFVDSKKRDRQNLALLFARTNLPTYIFRGDANQAFLSAIQKTDNIPDWRVIEKEMQEIETYKLSTIKLSASHYSVQLDHWTDHKKRLVLVILSWVDKNWDHFSQVVDFKRVSRSTALITAEEVKLTITGLGLDPKHCIAYRALLTNNNIHDIVKVFVSNLLSHFDHNSRFKEFPGIFLAACLINPQKSSRDCLTTFEMSIAKSFIHSLRDQVEETSSQEDVIDTALQQNVAAENSIDNILESIHFAESMHIANAEPRSLGEELEFFMTTINESKTAYQFFKSKRAEFPHLSQIARIILCTLPSPACAERAFSKAGYLSQTRRSNMNVTTIKTRLIVS